MSQAGAPQSVLRLMEALAAHARAAGATHVPYCSPSVRLVADGSVDAGALRRAGYRVIPWTANEPDTIVRLLALGVDGIITDRPDVLVPLAGAALAAGFEAQGHRGARDLRPENTLPSFEAALDCLVTGFETDVVVTRDGVPVLVHEPELLPGKTRRADGAPLDGPVLVKVVTLRELQAAFVADGLLKDRPLQKRDLALSPVAAAFAAAGEIPHAYAVPSLEQLFRFTDFYARFHGGAAGENAARARFNLELKLTPQDGYARSVDPRTSVHTAGELVMSRGLQDRCTIQSFDHDAVRLAIAEFPAIACGALLDALPDVPGGCRLPLMQRSS